MTQEESLEKGKERDENTNTARQERDDNTIGILPPDPDPDPFQPQGPGTTDSGAKQSKHLDSNSAKRAPDGLGSAKNGSPRNEIIKARRMTDNDGRRNTPQPGAHHESTTNSGEFRKARYGSRANSREIRKAVRVDGDGRIGGSRDGDASIATTLSREDRKAQRSMTASGQSRAGRVEEEPKTNSREFRKALRMQSSTSQSPQASRSNSAEFGSRNSGGGSSHPRSQSNHSGGPSYLRTPSSETLEASPSNLVEPADDLAARNAYMELEAQIVDDTYLEDEVERLREENQTIKAEQEQQRQQQEEQQHQQDEGMAVVIAEDVTEPNYTRQIIVCTICLIIAIVASVMGTMAYENSLDSTCPGLLKEILLEDVGDLHEDAFAWIVQNDTWLPSVNCDNAAGYFLERYALTVLYLDTQGPKWFTNNDGWLKPVSVCDWQQVVCDDFRHVIELDSVNKNFVGTIPSELGLLTRLTRLNFDLNELTGTIPSEIGTLTDLQGFFIAKNHLSGPIPTEAGRMTSLTRLNVIENDLSGTLPTEIGMKKWTAATRLLFHDCNFWGTLPSEIGNIQLLTRLDFFNNAFSGQLPSEIGSLTNMLHANVFNNSFSGTLPSEFGLLQKLVTLDIRNNTLEGSLPTEIGRVTTLEKLMTENNQLSGSIPPLPYSLVECELAPLGETGNCFSNLANQQNCEIEGNCPRFDPEVVLADFAPLNQDALNWLKNDTWTPPLWATDRFTYYLQRYALASLWLETDGDNWFNEGFWMSSLSVCDWHRILCNATEHVVFVDLVASNLGGSIPAELGLLQTLTRLNLDNNRLTGTLPSELALLSDVSGMFIYGNKLTGTIPTEWGNLSALTRLNLANNGGLAGTLPTEIGMWTSCTRIMLFGNKLSGTIPPLQSLSLLTKLELNDNAFTGALPDLGELISLKALDVRNNRLTGTIPSLPLNLRDCQLSSLDETGNCFCTDPSNSTVCVVEGNCQGKFQLNNITSGCDIGDDGAAGLNNTHGCFIGVNCTVDMNATIEDGL